MGSSTLYPSLDAGAVDAAEFIKRSRTSGCPAVGAVIAKDYCTYTIIFLRQEKTFAIMGARRYANVGLRTAAAEPLGP
jgi:hypothetical protein